ncbi:MAG: glycosyl transferase family 2, partial [Vicinamibacterales bacterium]
RFVFLHDLVSPAEVPVEMNAFKSQQHRWAKGSIQTCRKVLPSVLRSKLPLGVKAEAFFHLTANFN